MAETSKDRREQRPQQGDLQRQRTGQEKAGPQQAAAAGQGPRRRDDDDDRSRSAPGTGPPGSGHVAATTHASLDFHGPRSRIGAASGRRVAEDHGHHRHHHPGS